MDTIRRKLQDLTAKMRQNQGRAAQKTFMEELFNDYYLHRRQVYKMNFFRGIFFGLGSVLGGTIVVALIIWLLSLFVNFPVVGNYLQGAQNSIESAQDKR
jgi:hypothetical protein